MATVKPHLLAPFLLFSLCLPSVISSQSFNFNFSQTGVFNHGDLLEVFFLNSTHPNSQEGPEDAYEAKTEMTHSEMEMISQIIGGVVYTQPVTLWDEATGEVASFKLTLAFCLRNYQGRTSKNSTASRMAIFLGRHQQVVPPPMRSNGANHSNPNTTTTTKEQIIEVEFDAYLQEKQHNDGHSHAISVNVNYIVSKAQVNTTLPGNTKNQSSGCTMMILQIDYDGGRKRLDTGLRIGDVSHHINASVDLIKTMPKEVAIGFLSTTGQPIELHNVLIWSFNSTLGRTNSTVTEMPSEIALENQETHSSTDPWWQIIFRLDPRGWSMELNLQFEFQRIWDRISLAVSSSFNITLVRGIPNGI